MSLLSVHLLKLGNGKFLDMAFDEIDGVMVVSHVWPMTFETDHIECSCSFQGAVEVKILARILSFVQISGQSSV